MKLSPLNFYEELSPHYHLILKDFDKFIKYNGECLSKVLKNKTKKTKLLDCTCGIGSQIIGLSKYNFDITASDLSPSSLEREKIEAEKRNITNIKFEDALDIREMKKLYKNESFDICISCDNSIPHLFTENDLTLSIQSMYDVLKDNGILLLTIRL
eukprot:gene4845-8430_t